METEAAYIAVTSNKIINGEIIGFKKSDLKNPPLFEIRVFIKCSNCNYVTGNVNHSNNSEFDNNFVEDIAGKIIDLIREPKKKRKVDLDKRYKNYFKKNPTRTEIMEFMDKNKKKPTFDVTIFKKHLDEFLK